MRRTLAARWPVIAGAVVSGLLGAASPAAAEPCTTRCLPVGDQTVTTASGRRYLVHVPATYRPDTSTPLLLDLHGYDLTAEDQRNRSGQRAQSDQRGFIAVWPQGLNKSWNAYNCCGASNRDNVNDVGFLRTVIAEVKARANIDEGRVYVTGFSNGGGMAHRLACEASDVVRAAGPVSFPLNAMFRCNPARAVSVIAFAGTNDQTIKYGGMGVGIPIAVGGAPASYQSAPDSFASWGEINACSGGDDRALATGAVLSFFARCRDGVQVGLVTIEGGRHSLYANPSNLPLAAKMWTELKLFVANP